ncbi:terminase small subunit [uncultured Enterovirga sp.]|uniref:terminase small subunit n=1 Tax=uncultured Enterovirga sp. TaxID=2026352 RepID=UPI0035CB021D
MPLNRKQERFVEEYVIDMNGAQAAIRAGYARRTAKQIANNLMKVPHVRTALDVARQRVSERAEMQADEVLRELAKIARANMGEFMRATSGGDPYFDYASLTPDQTAALSEVTVEDFKEGRGEDARDVRRVKFKLHDKLGALEKLGRYHGLFKDKVEVTGKDGEALSAREEAPPDRMALALLAVLSGGNARP